jgi:maleylacetate reductase
MLSGLHRNPRQELVVYGRPAAEAVAETARGFGARRLLITSTKSLSGPGGLAAALARDLGDLCAGLFAGVSAHSPRESVIAGAGEARRAGADLLVAIGGGSVIDATKVMQIALWDDVRDVAALGAYRGGRTAPGGKDVRALAPGARMIAVPTTLSAAEFTATAGVTDAARKVKEGYAHRDLAPRAVILDPAMTLATPPALWFSTGLKAVDHAVEQLCNKQRAPFADALAAEGLKRLNAGLAATKANGADLDARLECQFGMWMAISGANAGRGMGASHAIGHTLGGSYGVPHGVTSCVTLPAVLAWNAEAAAAQEKHVAALMGRPNVAASDCVRDLARGLGLPTSLKEVGIGPDQFAAIAAHTMTDPGVRANPRPITRAEDIVEILELAKG